ncbi:hypothetical protein F5884DRAFT_463184 [Xylogone sp. PMI_703]|nr:hypothetical protein F5884DRAFT_463184 [Xylogone sp. PMI_703]
MILGISAAHIRKKPGRKCIHFEPRKKCVHVEPYRWSDWLFMGFRNLFTAMISTAGLVCGAEALLHYDNFPVLAMLGILYYATDYFLFQLMNLLHLIKEWPRPSGDALQRVVAICGFSILVIGADYRLSFKGLTFALALFGILHVFNVMSATYPERRRGDIHTWDCAFRNFLWCGLPLLVATSYAAWKLEDVHTALKTFESWSLLRILASLALYPLSYILYYGNGRQAYGWENPNLPSRMLEDSSDETIASFSAVFRASYSIVVLGLLIGRTDIDWIQVFAFAILHVYIVGLKHISLYPIGIYNWIRSVAGLPERQASLATAHKPVFMWTTALLFCGTITIFILTWSQIAFLIDGIRWKGPVLRKIENQPGSDPSSQLDIVISHSAGDSVDRIIDTLTIFTSLPAIMAAKTQFYIYTKDSNLTKANIHVASTKITPTVLANIGGETASILYHIMNRWDNLAMQTIFLSTSSPHTTERATRFKNYFIPADLEYPTIPSTGFLNLGGNEACTCDDCYDSFSWKDTFGLVPSMWSAARSNSQECSSTLLTYGNNFVASADRIRGTPKDVWNVLYEGLSNNETRNAWAHDPAKIGPAGKKMNGHLDSLERPFLGYTIERLWGILLQCSNKEIAWNCPNLLRGWRRGGRKEDCQCID